jgi:hypothetical protein
MVHALLMPVGWSILNIQDAWHAGFERRGSELK